tara:strand:+ start:1200 stop:2126 length:927 start_codon:yes stop_codon:yes gene_type:complete
MFTSIVFSKDRPLQLDLCLQSIKKNFFADNQIIVLYTTSEGYDKSYEKLAAEYPSVVFFKQSHNIFDDIQEVITSKPYSGRSEVYRAIYSDPVEYITFFTDDDIIYRPLGITEKDVGLAFENNACCISLRLGVNTTMRDYGDGVLRGDTIPSEVMRLGNLLAWNRTSIPTGGYWAYPLSVDGHIFKVSHMKKFVEELCVLNKHYANCGEVPRAKHAWSQTPNEFESKLQRFFFDMPPLMTCPEYSAVVNSPNNRVQNTAANRSGDVYNYAALDLKDEFEDGRRISLENITLDEVVCPHQEINILEGLL